MAADDWNTARLVAAWPVREGLIAYIRQARARAESDYRHAAIVYCLQAPYMQPGDRGSKPPKVPDILQLIELSE